MRVNGTRDVSLFQEYELIGIVSLCRALFLLKAASDAHEDRPRNVRAIKKKNIGSYISRKLEYSDDPPGVQDSLYMYELAGLSILVVPSGSESQV